ncbi:uncharacterized protein LOC117653547 isoform X2 [Thrips palmi]|uniref:ATP-dependent DNA helicase n=1 Tax=Thrips palmi TaxID=161013 RepID=A0A6P9AIE5_THRPL|nr:uncharacterized protein LOC117653547 isoform X2 [Thrips palmi]
MINLQPCQDSFQVLHGNHNEILQPQEVFYVPWQSKEEQDIQQSNAHEIDNIDSIIVIENIFHDTSTENINVTVLPCQNDNDLDATTYPFGSSYSFQDNNRYDSIHARNSCQTFNATNDCIHAQNSSQTVNASCLPVQNNNELDESTYPVGSSVSLHDNNSNNCIHAQNSLQTVNATCLPNKKPNFRKCAAKDCQSAGRHLFTFPSIMRNEQFIHDNFIRCKQWVQNAGNVKLLEMPASNLHNRHWLCSDHFEDDQFSNKMKKRLKPDAIPTVFMSLPLTRENMLLFRDHGRDNLQTDMHQDNDNDNVLNVQQDMTNKNSHQKFNNSVTIISMEQIFCGSPTSEETTQLDGTSYSDNSPLCPTSEDTIQIDGTSYSDNHPSCSQDVITHKLIQSPDRPDIVKTNILPVKKRDYRKCSAKECHSSGVSLFSFPTIMKNEQVIEENLSRCRQWVQNTGNDKLLEIPSYDLYKRHWLCSDHFEEQQFHNKMKKRLKPDAIPTIFNSLPLTTEKMLLFPVQGRRNLHTEMYQDNEHDVDVNGNNLDAYQKQFEQAMLSCEWRSCNKCKAKFMTQKDSKQKCVYSAPTCNKFAELDLDQKVPEELQCLTYIEEQLIAKIHPIVSVVKLKGHQLGYKGNIINYPQDVKTFAEKLPHKVTDLSCVLTIRASKGLKPVDFQVRAKVVRNALLWLKDNNFYYKDIEISDTNLALLPDDGNVFDLVQGIEFNTDEEPAHASLPNTIPPEENIEQEDEIYESGSPIMVKAASADQINSLLSWPSISDKPINEFEHDSYIVQAFPCLFPTGRGRLKFGKNQSISALNYFKHLMRYCDDRFAQHNRFRYFALNTYMRWSALKNGNLFIKTQPQLQNMTLTQLKEELEKNPAMIKKIMYRNSSISGTNSYWFARGKELLSMVEQLGLPTLFFTLSAADLHWPDLFRMLAPDEDFNTMSDYRRRQLVKANPLAVDSYFLKRAETFINDVLVKKFNVKDFWYRVEYQHRGSPHIHGIFWIENAPDVTNILQKTEEEQQEIIQYFNDLVTAFHPNQDQPPGNIHPCRKLLSEVQDLDQDLAELLNKVQRHTICSEQYCIRKCKKTHKKKCRFKFPQEEQNEAKIGLSETGNAEFIPRRNDTRLNKYNPYIAQTWRANTDVAPVISKQALINYLAKYISKSEYRSDHLKELMQIINSASDRNKNAKSAVQSLYIKACSERDFSAQETCHLLMGLKLYSSGKRDFVTIGFSDNEEWRLLRNNNDASSFMEKYQARSEALDAKCLWNVAKNYKLPNETRRQNSAILQIFPKYSATTTNPTVKEKYFRQQVLLYVPWREEKDLKNDDTTSWEEIYNKYIQIINLNAEQTNLFEQIQPEDDEFETHEINNHSRPEQWQLISQMGPAQDIQQSSLGNREIDRNYNWHQSAESYEEYGGIPALLTFMTRMKKEYKPPTATNMHDTAITLTDDQQSILNVAQQQINTLLDPTYATNMNIPQTVLIQGKAGTGKSLVIARIANLISSTFGEGSCLLVGPTGVCALNINGSTLHSKLKFNLSEEYANLNGDRLFKFQQEMKDVKFIIIDEFSMVGCEMLWIIDQRLRQGKDNPSEPFGGLFVFMFGDINQLPPVMDSAPYSDNQSSMERIGGKALYDSIHKVFILNNIHRQRDRAFQTILNNIASGNVTIEDYQMLQTRFEDCVYANSKEEFATFKDAPHFFSTNAEKDTYNEDKLLNMKDSQTGFSVPVAKIPAAVKNNGNIQDNEDHDLYLCKGAQIMLRKNVWTEMGLVNGSIGEIVDIIYDPNSTPHEDPPSVLICTFESYNGPCLDPMKKTIPIVTEKITLTKDDNDSISITQFPINLNYACTIYKSQGLTVSKACVDLGPKEMKPGLTYVAFSRAKTLEGLLLKPFPFSRIQNLNKSLAIKKRQNWLNHLQ